MAKNSKIEWTHHTFNPWWGCANVSPGCDHCYAESWARRVGHDLWGSRAARRLFSDDHWKQPLRWNDEAKAQRVRKRVFCASMADVFELRADVASERRKLWSLIEQTPWLDWLLLTKRPQNIARLSPWASRWPGNVWIGTTVESQQWAERRLPHLLKHPAAVRFVSAEPLLGPLELSKWLRSEGHRFGKRAVNWVIAGGESGARARPMHPSWAIALRDQCAQADVPFHFKQWGHWSPATFSAKPKAKVWVFNKEGKLPAAQVFAVGKKAAGRTLFGRAHNGVPEGKSYGAE